MQNPHTDTDSLQFMRRIIFKNIKKGTKKYFVLNSSRKKMKCGNEKRHEIMNMAQGYERQIFQKLHYVFVISFYNVG